VNRRIFIALAGGCAASWSFGAPAQRIGQVRRVAVLMNVAADHPEGRPRLSAFLDAMRKLGWRDGDNVRFDVRWGGDDADRDRQYAEELIALRPDIIFVTGTLETKAIQRENRSLPTVFALVTDPVGSGFIDSLSHPGGNETGFMAYDYSIAGKWLDILKQIAPNVTRVGVVRDPGTPQGIGLFSAIQIVAPSVGVEVSAINARDADEAGRNIAAFARPPNGGLVVIPAADRGAAIAALAARYALPSIHGVRSDVIAGGLASYGPDRVELFRQAAGYVDRILKGAKPADLPVQEPTKYELLINLNVAKTLGLTVPPVLLARADEVIE